METTHQVQTGEGSFRATVSHRASRAIQYDFYIPTNLWNVPEVRRFFDALAALGGATVFERQTGIWKGEQEKTDVFRLLVRTAGLSAAKVRETLRREIGQLMATLSASAEFAQEALLYTETVVTVALAEKVTRLD